LNVGKRKHQKSEENCTKRSFKILLLAKYEKYLNSLSYLRANDPSRIKRAEHVVLRKRREIHAGIR
jgi:hypothetical protein